MNKKFLIVFSTGLLVAACVAPPQQGPMGPGGTTGCVEPPVVVSCTGNPDMPKVTLNLITMKANPPNVCARANTTIDVSIVPKVEASVGNVHVLPKNFADYWLVGTNDPDKLKIYIKIPDTVSFGTDHDYGFVTTGGKCADPRVHVM